MPQHNKLFVYNARRKIISECVELYRHQAMFIMKFFFCPRPQFARFVGRSGLFRVGFCGCGYLRFSLNLERNKIFCPILFGQILTTRLNQDSSLTRTRQFINTEHGSSRRAYNSQSSRMTNDIITLINE